jgi:hypothetical protein
MFRVVLTPIIRSAYNCIYSILYLSHRYCYLPLSWMRWNRFECAVGGVCHAHVSRGFGESLKILWDVTYYQLLYAMQFIPVSSSLGTINAMKAQSNAVEDLPIQSSFPHDRTNNLTYCAYYELLPYI